jgi:hypothetical protein
MFGDYELAADYVEVKIFDRRVPAYELRVYMEHLIKALETGGSGTGRKAYHAARCLVEDKMASPGPYGEHPIVLAITIPFQSCDLTPSKLPLRKRV